MIMTSIQSRNSIHMNIVENILPIISARNRQFVFTYIDIEQDNYLVNYFKINTSQLPNVIVYDFEDRKFYVDNSSIYDEQNPSEEVIINKVNRIIEDVKSEKVIWSTGNWFEDVLLRFGVKMNQHTMMYILAACFVMIVIIMVVIIFFCGEKGDTEQTAQFIEEMKNKMENSDSTNSNNIEGKLNEEKEVSSAEKKTQ